MARDPASGAPLDPDDAGEGGPGGGGGPSRRPAPSGGRPRADVPARYDERGRRIVSEATVAERRDPSVREASRPGPLPPPAGWPLEALAYPFRGRGAFGLLLACGVFAAADLATVANAFVGALLKVFLYVGLLRWQVRSVAATATGADVAPPPFVGADLEPEALTGLLGTAWRVGLYLLPAAFVAAQPFLATPEHPVLAPSERFAAWGLLALGLLLAPVMLLGNALRWPGIAWPWHAVLWLARGLWPCVLTGLSWGACVAAELAVAAFPPAPAGRALLVFAAIRLGVLALALVGARGLGVLGRRYAL